MERNERMLKESRNTVTVPSVFVLRFLSYLSRRRRLQGTCVFACVCACGVRVCAYMRVCACVCVCACVYMRAYSMYVSKWVNCRAA